MENFNSLWLLYEETQRQRATFRSWSLERGNPAIPLLLEKANFCLRTGGRKASEEKSPARLPMPILQTLSFSELRKIGMASKLRTLNREKEKMNIFILIYNGKPDSDN